MNYKNFENNIVICSNLFKKKILDNCYQNKKIINFKIMDINEFITNITFKYDTKTIYYIMNKYKVKYEIALIYLNNLKFVTKEYDNKKLKELSILKKELLQNKLICENNLFINYIKNKKIIFYNINYDLKFLQSICKDLKVEFINDKYDNDYEKEIYHFSNINDEVLFVGEHIIELLNKGINISKIKIVGLTNEYRYPIKLIFGFLNLPINVDELNLYSNSIGKYFLNNIKENISDTISIITKKYQNSNIINQIIDICNKYYWCNNFIDIKELLIYDLKNTKLKVDKIFSEIEIINYSDIDINSSDYYYFLGFNNENVPKIYKDTEYISDNLCELLNKETSNERYLREKEEVLNKIKNTKNMIITYKDQTYFNKYSISSLNEELNYKIVGKFESDVSYSKEFSHLRLTELLDKFEKYGEVNNELEKLYTSLDTDYKTYNNEYSGIDSKALHKYLNNELLLSYTAIDNYYKCAFKYYINSILKIDEYESNFGATIGSFMHYILSIYNKNNFNLDEEYNNYLNTKFSNLSSKERFFMAKMKENLKFIISELVYQKTLTDFNKELYEQKIILENNYKIKINLIGIIDKIMYLEKDNKTYVVVIDYKTGSIDTGLKHIENGIGLQLPIYAYLINKSNKFHNLVISGLYYQKLLDSEIKSTSLEDYVKQKKNRLKLQGYSTTDEEILGLFDSTYQNSDLIKGMKKASGGFSSFAKVLSDNQISELINVASKKIDEAIKNIVDGNFIINPKQIGFENISCKYCKYKDICFVKPDNIKILEEGD